MAPGNNRSLKRQYTNEEQRKIVNYIISHNLYFHLKGNKMWKEMEQMQVCPNRTWQSLKEHFTNKIINILPLLNIGVKEQERISNGFHKNIPVKRQILSSSSNNSDDEDPFNKHIKLNGPLEELIDSTPLSEEKIYTVNSAFDNANKNTNSDEPTENNIVHEMIAIKNIRKPYSEDDDQLIIKFFKDNMEYLTMKDDETVYEMLQNKFSLQKSVQSLRMRFLNVILPNLYKYNVMDISDLIVFYDRARMRIPTELVNIINEEIYNRSSEQQIPQNQIDAITSTPIVLNLKVSTESETPSLELSEHVMVNTPPHRDEKRKSKEVADAVTQCQYENENYTINELSNYLCINSNVGQHVFISNEETNLVLIQNEFEEKYQIPRSNIHFVNSSEYNFLSNYKKQREMLDVEIKKRLDKYSNTSESIGENNQITPEHKKRFIGPKKSEDKMVHLPLNNIKKEAIYFNELDTSSDEYSENENVPNPCLGSTSGNQETSVQECNIFENVQSLQNPASSTNCAVVSEHRSETIINNMLN